MAACPCITGACHCWSRTASVTMPQDDVPEGVKRRRLNEAIGVYREVLAARNAAEVGRRHLILLEGPSLRDPAILTGGRPPPHRHACLHGRRLVMCHLPTHVYARSLAHS